MTKPPKCSFSIDHILNVAGTSVTTPLRTHHFDWINCTRFRPPRIQRARKKEGVQRRNAGRNPRIPFSQLQIASLEDKFHQKHYLSSQEVHQLARELRLSDARVKIWFQNRRARERRKEHDITANDTVSSATTVLSKNSRKYDQPPKKCDTCVRNVPTSPTSSGNHPLGFNSLLHDHPPSFTPESVFLQSNTTKQTQLSRDLMYPTPKLI